MSKKSDIFNKPKLDGSKGRRLRWDKKTQNFVEISELLYGNGQVGLNLISDDMAPTKHPITGEVFTSKSAFRAVTKAHGGYEVGNDKRTYEKPKGCYKQLRNNLREVFSNYGDKEVKAIVKNYLSH